MFDFLVQLAAGQVQPRFNKITAIATVRRSRMAGFLLFPLDEAVRACCYEPGDISVIPALVLALLWGECTPLLPFKATSAHASGTAEGFRRGGGLMAVGGWMMNDE
ncbi:MAG: hypothetical protein V3R60_08540 [Acidobacteriota bacterium]